MKKGMTVQEHETRYDSGLISREKTDGIGEDSSYSQAQHRSMCSQACLKSVL